MTLASRDQFKTTIVVFNAGLAISSGRPHFSPVSNEMHEARIAKRMSSKAVTILQPPLQRDVDVSDKGLLNARNTDGTEDVRNSYFSEREIDVIA